MKKQDQIEEMAGIIERTKKPCDCLAISECITKHSDCKLYKRKEWSCVAYTKAENLYNAGYRKSDEIQLECENASLTVENEVLKRDVQNLERTLEEGREAIENLKADKNILLIELEDAERKIKEYKSGETITLTKTEYERLEKAEMEAVLSSYHLRENVRKETAKELLQELYNEAVQYGKTTVGIEWMAQKYGVEVK